MKHHPSPYQLFSVGDLSATFALIFDILSVIVFNSTILIFGFDFPKEIITNHIIPATCLGLIVGGILFMILNYRLYKQTGVNSTAIPFGVDAPSAIATAVCVVGPLYKLLLEQNDPHAAINAWYGGVCCLFLIAVIKLGGAFFASFIHKHLPRGALLGAISGVAIAFIGFVPLVAIFGNPIIGFVSMGIIFMAMFGKIKMPFKIPGILLAIILALILYYGSTEISDPQQIDSMFSNITFNLYLLHFNPQIVFTHPTMIFQFISVAIPFAVLTIVGSLTIAESAKAEKAPYKARDLILIDGIATLVAALFGGVMQTTPYAGYPAYVKMQARSGFLLINAILVAICATFGLISIFIQIIPEAIIAPVLLFVAFEIMAQAFIFCDKNHYPVVLFALLPALAKLIVIKITDPQIIAGSAFEKLAFMEHSVISEKLAMIMIGNGFIISGLLWGTVLYLMIEHRWLKATMFSLILAFLSYFGVIHSIFLSGVAYLPWNLAPQLIHYPTLISEGYLVLGGLMFLTYLIEHARMIPGKSIKPL